MCILKPNSMSYCNLYIIVYFGGGSFTCFDGNPFLEAEFLKVHRFFHKALEKPFNLVDVCMFK